MNIEVKFSGDTVYDITEAMRAFLGLDSEKSTTENADEASAPKTGRTKSKKTEKAKPKDEKSEKADDNAPETEDAADHDDVRAAIQKLMAEDDSGGAIAKELLGEFGVAKVSELKPEQCGEFIEKVNEKLG